MKLHLLALTVCSLLAACGGTNTPPPITTPPPSPATLPYECPEGMPSYKCQQLQEEHRTPR